MRAKGKGLGLYITTVAVSAALLFIGNLAVSTGLDLFPEGKGTDAYAKVKILSIEDRIEDSYSMGGSDPVATVEVVFRAKRLDGPRRGEILDASQLIDSSLPLYGSREVEVGDKVLLYDTDQSYGDGSGARAWQFAEYIRTDKLVYLGLLLAASLFLFGRRKGFHTILSLGLTCLAVFSVFVPAILSGRNIYLWAILVCLYTIVMTFLIVNGYNRKTLAASLGSFGGILLAGLMTAVMDRILGLTGIIDDESVYLTYIFPEAAIDLRAIIFAAIIIGAVGAVMDVSMSISSSLWELREQACTVSFEMLYRSGVNIGRDIMGTMANTLVLAYIGSSLSVVLLLTAYSTSLSYLLNREMVVVEILQALVGSFGLLLAMPLTSLIAGVLYTRDLPLPAEGGPGGQLSNEGGTRDAV